MDEQGGWVGLFSGGKDSSFALYQAQQRGYAVEQLVTVAPAGDSYMYQRANTELVTLAAESIGIELVTVDLPAFEQPPADTAARGDDEIEPLEQHLRTLDEHRAISGLVTGAIASEYQRDRIAELCDRVGIELFAPLWNRDPVAIARDMLAAGFEIRIIEVAAAGLDQSWVGRRLDDDALTELLTLQEQYGVHPLGEGGEFETFVTDGPHMRYPIELTYTTEWDGMRGNISITKAEFA